jgi:hypothetical protein
MAMQKSQLLSYILPEKFVHPDLSDCRGIPWLQQLPEVKLNQCRIW